MYHQHLDTNDKYRIYHERSNSFDVLITARAIVMHNLLTTSDVSVHVMYF